MLYVESVMDLRPWGYWTATECLTNEPPRWWRSRKKSSRGNPQHPGALHFYIHLMEAYQADKGRSCGRSPADTDARRRPHGPHAAHIYQRVGRYADAQRSNEMAIAADEDYISQCRAQGLYPMAYYPHNLHFLWFASTAEGNSRIAIEARAKQPHRSAMMR
jgi:hypothetical protein